MPRPVKHKVEKKIIFPDNAGSKPIFAIGGGEPPKPSIKGIQRGLSQSPDYRL